MTKTVRINTRGALTLPKAAREKLGVDRGGKVVVQVMENGHVVLRAESAMPCEVYDAARIREFEKMNEAPLTMRRLKPRKVRGWTVEVVAPVLTPEEERERRERVFRTIADVCRDSLIRQAVESYQPPTK